MIHEFSQFGLHPLLVRATEDIGYTNPTPIQSLIIPVMLTGQDVIGQAQTGTGKTAAFALPILNNLAPSQRNVQCLVMAPTRELALQVAKAFEDYGRHLKLRVLAIYGGTPYNRQINQLQRGVDIVVGTPGRLLDLIQKKVLHLNAVQTVVLDEADEMLSMGFIEDIEAILSETPLSRQTALFSATMPAAIQHLAESYMHAPQVFTIPREQLTVAAIDQRYYLVNEADKLAALTRLFEVEPIASALIFVRTRAGTGELANELTVRGFPAETLNGDLSQEVREQVMNRFRHNQIKVLVATDVAARGLDIEDISHVFNFDLPEDPEVYVHRIGRTGRAGKAGIAISLVTPKEGWRLRRIEAFARQKIGRASLPSVADIQSYREEQLLKQVQVWLQRGRCKRERELVADLVQAGYDPLELAAVALKMARAEEQQRPIAPLSEVLETRIASTHRSDRSASRQTRDGERFERTSRIQRRDRQPDATISHEKGMVRLSLNRGKMHGIRTNEVVSTIAYQADIPGSTLGKIFIHDRFTYVDVPEKFVDQVLTRAGECKIHRQPVKIEMA